MIGHNPKANQQEFEDVTALLRELPRVAVPTDFNASLKARIAAAKAEANEFAGVTALVKELPRVAAPADFDFKLRARIAQAKAEQQKTSAGWFAEWFGRTFSWAQASAAMAAVAIVVSVVSFGILRSGKDASTTGSTTIARAVNPTPSAQPAQEPTATKETQPIVNPPQTFNMRANASVRPKTVNAVNRPTTSAIITGEQRVVPATAVPATLVATKVMIKHRSGEARMVNLSEYNLGLQTAHLRSTPVTPRTEQTAMANIY